MILSPSLETLQMMRLLPLLLVFALLGAARSAQAQQPVLPRVTPAEAGMDAAALERATDVLEQYVAEGRIPGAVAAVARDGRLGYFVTVGVQDLESRRPMDERSIFRIYSMAKSVTAVAAMMLHEQGAFALEDPVSRYLPEFAEVRVRGENGTRSPSRPITVRDLLLHTSGLNHRTSEVYREARVRDRNDPLPVFVRKIVAVPLMEDPGTAFRYSESPTVLGRLVEIWSGEELDDFFRDRIFEPLGMTDTGFWVEPADQARLVGVYGPSAGGGLAPVEIEEVGFTRRPALLEGAVGLVSTVPDFLRFSQMLADGGALGSTRLLQEETVGEMVQNGLAPGLTSFGGAGWGLANVTVDEPTGEYSWNGSAGTVFWVSPETGVVGVLMTQTSPAFPQGLRQRFKSAVEESILPR